MSMQSSTSGGSSGTLSSSDQPTAPPTPEEDVSGVEDQWSAVINCQGCNLQQIEVAIAANTHLTDPHPADPTKRVRRHPVYLVAEDYTNLDAEGRPAPGTVLELDLPAVRGVFSARHNWVAADAPPADGSFVHVAGMDTIPELDQAGNATGRVILGTRGA
ncbi:MAG TPA: hypothetical protein VF821_34110 [Lentzea sp.]